SFVSACAMDARMHAPSAGPMAPFTVSTTTSPPSVCDFDANGSSANAHTASTSNRWRTVTCSMRGSVDRTRHGSPRMPLNEPGVLLKLLPQYSIGRSILPVSTSRQGPHEAHPVLRPQLL